MNRLAASITAAVTTRWLLTRSRQWQAATTRHLRYIIHLLEQHMNAHEAITLAVNNAITAMQTAIDDLARHATENEDDDLNALASRLQGAVSALSTASTRHGVEIPPTGTTGGDTVTGAGTPTGGATTTSDTVPGAGGLVREGRPTFGDGTPAQGDQTGTAPGTADMLGRDTVVGTAVGNDTVTGADTTSRRRP